MCSQIQSYPSDILIEIFEYALPSKETFKRRHVALTAIRLVCSHWNYVAITTSQFWSSIHILFQSQVIPTSILNIWFTRSTGAALNITLRDPASLWSTPVELGCRTELLHAIKKHVCRCRYLRLDMSSGILLGFWAIRMAEAQNLEHLEVRMTITNDDPEHNKGLLRQLSCLPSLRHLAWSTHCRTFTELFLCKVKPPWLDRLARIELTCPIEAGGLLQLLNSCTSAMRVTLGNSVRRGKPMSMNPACPPTPLPNLRILDISLDPSVYRAILHHLSFPNLQVLKLKGVSTYDVSDTIRIWAPSLDVLRVHDCEFTSEGILSFLHHPDVTRIPIVEVQTRRELRNSPDFDVFFRDAAREFERSNDGPRLFTYAKQSRPFECCVAGWVDGSVYRRYIHDFPLDRGVLTVHPCLFDNIWV